MSTPQADNRSPARRAADEKIADEPKMPFPEVPPDAIFSPVEAHLSRIHRRPLALEGVVENGLIRLLDPVVKLPEHSRVIVVARE